jgi:amino acid transporter
MAEELQDSAYTLPRTMIWATVINGGLMFIMAITVCYCIGDVETGKRDASEQRQRDANFKTVLLTPTGYLLRS